MRKPAPKTAKRVLPKNKYEPTALEPIWPDESALAHAAYLLTDTGASTPPTPPTPTSTGNIMGNLVISWKTSAAGVAMIFGGIGDVLTQLSTGHWDGARLMADWTALTGGLGFLFAKDANVTGGTTVQPSK